MFSEKLLPIIMNVVISAGNMKLLLCDVTSLSRTVTQIVSQNVITALALLSDIIFRSLVKGPILLGGLLNQNF